MKKIVQIFCLVLVVCILASSCASQNKSSVRKSQIGCPAYGYKSNGYERLPY
ncbi:MAG: hypothetical protein LBU91_00915 [Bacteroidales bacterium]|nr:hypothetical protein [Bacteroidales bacterium]